MRKITLCFFIISLIFCDETLFKKANESYLNKNYEKALEYYRQILNNRMESVALYFNMGNCYYKLSQPGNAILYYEKALKLSPLDEDIRENLAIVNEEIIDKFEAPEQIFIFDLYNMLKYSLSLNQFFMLISISFLLILASIIVKRFYNQKLGSNILSISSVLFIFALILSLLRLGESGSSYGILIKEKDEVYTSPDAENEAFILHEGAKFQLIRESNRFYEISTIDGKTGWVSIEAVGEI